jgi:hypothetical protein
VRRNIAVKKAVQCLYFHTAARWAYMGTFKRTERAFWFVLGALLGGAVVAAFLILLETKVPRFTPT